jgi:hypothetical protein
MTQVGGLLDRWQELQPPVPSVPLVPPGGGPEDLLSDEVLRRLLSNSLAAKDVLPAQGPQSHGRVLPWAGDMELGLACLHALGAGGDDALERHIGWKEGTFAQRRAALLLALFHVGLQVRSLFMRNFGGWWDMGEREKGWGERREERGREGEGEGEEEQSL